MPNRMDIVSELVSEIEELTAGCLGCGEPVPKDSLSDIFCAKIAHHYWCGAASRRNDMGCPCEPDLDSCQTEALHRQVDNPYGAESLGELDGLEEARWRPELVDDPSVDQDAIRRLPRLEPDREQRFFEEARNIQIRMVMSNATVSFGPSLGDLRAPTRAELDACVPIGTGYQVVTLVPPSELATRAVSFIRETTQLELTPWQVRWLELMYQARLPQEPEVPGSSPRERALEAHRNRNTGPEIRRRAPRRIDPRGAR